MPASPSARRIQEYYRTATADYRYWSPRFNMHFGYFRRGLRPWKREDMLEELSRQVAQRVARSSIPRRSSSRHWLDAGCGLAATARTAVAAFARARVTGVTLVPEQAATATLLNRTAGLDRRIKVLTADYTALPFEAGTFDGAWALESACYAEGPDKRDFLQEMARVLKPGARLVVADGFLKRPGPLPPTADYCYRAVCRRWAISEMARLEAFLGAARTNGFVVREARDISWRVAPSFLHIIPVSLRFAFDEWRRGGGTLHPERRNNLLAPLLAQLLGIRRRWFGYYIVVLEKPVAE